MLSKIYILNKSNLIFLHNVFGINTESLKKMIPINVDSKHH
jgi:hypothetical protein